MKKAILILFAIPFLCIMGCESDVLETDTSSDIVNISNKKGEVTSLEFDRKSGDLLSSSDNFSEKSDITNGTVYKIVYHDNGNRTIYCWESQEVCYEKGVGPGPCGPCDDDV
jgi:hypothetical protein